jgi:hypothetical protein
MTLGAIPYVIIALAIFGMVLIVMGTMLDYILQIDNDLMADPSLPYSWERQYTMGLLLNIFRWLGVVALLCACIFLVMNAVQSQSGEI